MPNEQIYTDQLAVFNGKYNMGKFDLKKLIENEIKFRYVNNFLMKSSMGDSSAEQFAYFAGKTLSIYFSNATTLNDQGKYMSNFNAQEFLDDFEALADAKYRSELQEDDVYSRQKCDNATSQAISAEFRKYTPKMRKTLPTMWMEKLKEGSMSMDELHATTKRNYDSMDKAWNKNETTMAGSLTNVVAGYEATKQLRDSRKGFFGWLWKLFNGTQNRQEEAYFNELSTQVENLKKHFNVDKISSELTGKTVLGKEVKAKEKAKEAPKAKTVKIEPVLVPLNHKRNDVWFKGEFAKKCFRQIPEKAKKTVNELMI